MKRIHLASALCGLVLAVGCSHSSVTERADDLWSRPNWATVTKPSWEEDGKKYFVGYIELSGEASKSGALNMSDEKALSEPMRALVDQFLDQNQVGEDLRKDSSVGQRIISAARGFRPPMPALTIVNRYWETVSTSPYDNSLRAFSLAEIPVAEFEKAKRDYLARLNGNTEMRKILRDVGQKQRDKILED